MEFRQLMPEPATVRVEEVVSALDFGHPSRPDLPRTLANFIASVDGRAAFKGRSGALGNEGDRALFHGLRERVDAVLAGTGTLRAERYGRLIPDPERRLRRERAGLSPEPLACLVTRSGDVPFDIPLFAEPESRVVIFSAVDLDVSKSAAHVDVVRMDAGALTLAHVLGRLRSEHQIRSLLCEGGPTMFGSLVRESLVDELFLTVSPSLAGGGTSPTIASGPELPELRPVRPLWVLERDGALYLRYAIA